MVSAIRYTFADTAHTYDDLLSALVIDFLSAMLDADLVSPNTAIFLIAKGVTENSPRPYDG